MIGLSQKRLKGKGRSLEEVRSTVLSVKNESKRNPSGCPIVQAVWAYGMRERNGKYTVDGLLCSVLKTVTVTVIVSQKEAGIFDTIHGYYSPSILRL